MTQTSYLVPQLSERFDAQITLPGSKSIALRQLAMAALSEGDTLLSGIPPCDDTEAMLDCLAQLGVAQQSTPDGLLLTGPMQLDGDVTLNARMSGASTRLLIGLAALRRGKTHIDGHSSLRARTNDPLFAVLREHGCTADSDSGGLPVTIQGPLQVTGEPQVIQVDGSLSSQYITALLVIAPLLNPDTSQPVTIELTGDLVSTPYINITLNEMRKRGADAAWRSNTDQATPATTPAPAIVVQPGHYAAGSFVVEGDATAATYFSALATLHGSRVTLTNLGDATCQGDYQFCAVMEQLGARVERNNGHTTIAGPTSMTPLPPQDMTAMPDAALTLIAMAPLLPEGAQISGLSSLHHKECDRLESPAAEFVPMGIQASTTPDSIDVKPLGSQPMQPHTLTTYHDHRMAMAFSLLGSVSGNLTIDDKQVVDKTFPAYWQVYEEHLVG